MGYLPQKPISDQMGFPDEFGGTGALRILANEIIELNVSHCGDLRIESCVIPIPTVS